MAAASRGTAAAAADDRPVNYDQGDENDRPANYYAACRQVDYSNGDRRANDPYGYDRVTNGDRANRGGGHHF